MNQNEVMAAIEVFKSHLQDCIDYAEYGEDDYNKRLLRANDIAIQALGKQVAKPLNVHVVKNYQDEEETECAVCGNPYAENNYCSCCGQKIDWSGCGE